ncbi:MAG: class I SAM-dependent methyltransferase [Candidatus Rokuibacteriota bacterium]
MSVASKPSLDRAIQCLLCQTAGPILYAGLPDRLFGIAGRWNLRRCPRCGLVWIEPCPPPEELGRLYAGYYTHTIEAPTTGMRLAVKNAILAAAFGYPELTDQIRSARGLAAIGLLKEMAGLSVMLLDGRRRGRLLDVGCGNGQFVAAMRTLGWDARGIDVDEGGLAVARQHFGVPVTQGTLAEARFPAHSFDAVTLHHVIEHVPDPVDVLRECGRILQPGGRIVVVTPNIESLGHRLFRTRWLGLDVPRHLQLFSTGNLRIAAELAGLVVESMSTATRQAFLIGLSSLHLVRAGVLPGARPPRIGPGQWLIGAAFQALEHTLSRVAPLGEEIVMIATRAGAAQERRAGESSR